MTYDDVRSKVECPVVNRCRLTLQRKNGTYHDIKLRKYHLTDKELEEIKKSSGGNFPNPYKRRGIYRAVVQSLIDLGVNEYHTFKTFRDRTKEVMSGYSNYKKPNFWIAFVNKKSKNKETGKDANGRIIQTAQILQRITGYNCPGKKLEQLNASIHISKIDGIMCFKLDTNTPTPFNGI